MNEQMNVNNLAISDRLIEWRSDWMGDEQKAECNVLIN